jgi:hypothetical protein
MHWWTRRGARANDQQTQLQQLLTRSVEAGGRDVRHITKGYLDRELASGAWLRLLLDANICFVLRCKKRQMLLNARGAIARANWRWSARACGRKSGARSGCWW